MAGSLKRGWVTASLLIGKLQSYPRKNRLTRALEEHGRLTRTVFILRYLESEDFRRRILGQLNKGEALHSLREFLLFANKGTLREKQEELGNQAARAAIRPRKVIAKNLAAASNRSDEDPPVFPSASRPKRRKEDGRLLTSLEARPHTRIHQDKIP